MARPRRRALLVGARLLPLALLVGAEPPGPARRPCPPPPGAAPEPQTPTPPPPVPVVRVAPFVPTNLGDRVVEPTTVYVHAPGATRVAVYTQPVEAPYGGRHLGRPRLLGEDAGPCRTAEGAEAAATAWGIAAPYFAVPWAADEPYPYVEVFAVAYYSAGDRAGRTSRPVDILLDWRPGRRPTP